MQKNLKNAQVLRLIERKMNYKNIYRIDHGNQFT